MSNVTGESGSADIHEALRLDLADLRRRTGDLAALAGVRETEHTNGAERGVRVLTLRNLSGLEVDVLVERAFDIGDVRWRGVPIAWRSGNGFRHPNLHEVDAEDGLAWLRTIDGFNVSAGLDHTLFGGEYDATHYNYPPKQTIRHGLHGRLSSLPGRVTAIETDWDSGVISVRGEVLQATAFGEHLLLRRRVEIDLYGSDVRLVDEVENLGFERTPHMFLYHVNIGWPIVDAGTRFIAPVTSHLWASDATTEQGVGYDVLPEPQRGFVEQVWEHALVTGDDGLNRVALVRADGTLGIEVSWDAEGMPAFFEWLNLRDGQYGVGLEPGTNHVHGESAAREDGSLTWLEHGDRRSYSTTFTVLDGREATAAAEARIRAIGGQP